MTAREVAMGLAILSATTADTDFILPEDNSLLAELAYLLATFRAQLFGVVLSARIVNESLLQLRSAIHMVHLSSYQPPSIHAAPVCIVFCP